MDVRIGNSRIGGPEASRTEQVPASAATGSNPVRRSTQGDSVELSPMSEAVQTASSYIESRHAERVKALGALHRSGQYHVEPAKVAGSMVTIALGTGNSKDPA